MRKPVALVTGGARGIGLGISRRLAQNGFDLALCGTRPADAVADTLAELRGLGAAVLYQPANISAGADRLALLDAIRAHYGRLNVLVNNAGVAPKVRADILEASEESFDYVLGINLRGPYFLTQTVAKWMLAQRQEQPGEAFRIVNISSISVYTASVNRGDYCLSKAGIGMMTQLFAARLAADGIYVYEVRPGIVQTDMTSGVKEKYDKLIAEGVTPIRKWVMPDDVGVAVAALATGQIPMSTGQVIDVDGGFHLRVL